MQKLNDLSRSLTPFEPDGTLIAVIEMSLKSWLVAGIVPGVERQPLKKLGIDEGALLTLLHRWREPSVMTYSSGESFNYPHLAEGAEGPHKVLRGRNRP